MVEGTIGSSRVFGRQVVVHRRIEIALGRAELTVSDRIENTGTVPAAAPILYHVNFGAPFPARARLPRNDVSRALPPATFPEPTDDVTEGVWEISELASADDGTITAHVRGSRAGLTASVSWDGHALSRCVEWLYPGRRGWAVGIEPANARIFGPERQGPWAGAPVVVPGEHFVTGLRIAVNA